MSMVKKLAEEQEKAVAEAEAAAETSGTANPALEPEKVNTPLPGTTGDLDVVTTDQATSLNPNVVVSGTKPDGEGGQVLLDVVDPSVANAALLGPTVARKPQSPSEAPENGGRVPREGEVRFKVTADNEPWYSGGALKKDQVYVMSREEAELLVGTKAGNIEGGSSEPAPAPKASAKDRPSSARPEAKSEGSDAE
jgi:hypothetical protein